jgi:hypothetical protein
MRASVRHWVRFSSRTALGRPADGDLQRRIAAQLIEIVAILVAGCDRHHARQRHLGVGVRNAPGIARIANRFGNRLGQPEPRRNLAQHDQPAIRGQSAGIELGCERLARDR